MQKIFQSNLMIKESMRWFYFSLCSLFLLSSPFLEGMTAKQNLTVSYFDDATLHTRLPYSPNFVKGSKKEEVNKGFMLFYERKFLEFLDIGACYFGGSLGKWEKASESVYSGSVFFSPRLWIFHFAAFHPFVECSLLGPTLLSKKNFASLPEGSFFLFQNYLSLGIEIGGAGGLLFDAKILRYYRADLTRPKEGFQVPLLLSAGLSF